MAVKSPSYSWDADPNAPQVVGGRIVRSRPPVQALNYFGSPQEATDEANYPRNAGTTPRMPVSPGTSDQSMIPDGTPDIPTHAPTPDELRLIHRQQINNAQQADTAARAARADEYRRTGSVVSLDPSVLAMRQHADQQSELAHRFGMRLQPTKTPEQHALDTAELQRQFADQTTGPNASRIPAPPSAFNDVSKFFLGDNGRDIYPGAGDAAMRMIHANSNRIALNSDQNRPRDLTFSPYTQPAPDTTADAEMSRLVMAHRAREALGRHLAANDMENLGNESDAGVQTGRTNLILAKGGTANAPAAVTAEGTGLGAKIAGDQYNTAKSNADTKAIGEGTDIDSLTRQQKLWEIKRNQAATQGGISDPGMFVANGKNFAEALDTGTWATSKSENEAKYGAFDNQTIRPLYALSRSGPEGKALAKRIAAEILPSLKTGIFASPDFKKAIESRANILRAMLE
jgi:hypothetical protein